MSRRLFIPITLLFITPIVQASAYPKTCFNIYDAWSTISRSVHLSSNNTAEVSAPGIWPQDQSKFIVPAKICLKPIPSDCDEYDGCKSYDCAMQDSIQLEISLQKNDCSCAYKSDSEIPFDPCNGNFK